MCQDVILNKLFRCILPSFNCSSTQRKFYKTELIKTVPLKHKRITSMIHFKLQIANLRQEKIVTLFNKLTSVLHASVLLLIMNFVLTRGDSRVDPQTI